MKKILDNIVLYVCCFFIAFEVVLLSLYFIGPKATVEVLKDFNKFVNEITDILENVKRNNNNKKCY